MDMREADRDDVERVSSLFLPLLLLSPSPLESIQTPKFSSQTSIGEKAPVIPFFLPPFSIPSPPLLSRERFGMSPPPPNRTETNSSFSQDSLPSSLSRRGSSSEVASTAACREMGSDLTCAICHVIGVAFSEGVGKIFAN